jgi:hypothetical protein
MHKPTTPKFRKSASSELNDVNPQRRYLPLLLGLIAGIFIALLIFSEYLRSQSYSSQTRLLQQSGWKVFTLPKRNFTTQKITALAYDPMRQIWVGVQDGVFRFDLEEWNYYNTTPHYLSKIVDLIVDPLGNVWVNDGDSIDVVVQNELSTISSYDGSKYQLLAMDHLGNFIIGRTDFQGSIIGPITLQGNGDYVQEIDQQILEMTFSPDNRLWIGTPVGVSVLENSQWVEYPLKYPIAFMSFDSEGNLWASPGWAGKTKVQCQLFLMRLTGNEWRRFDLSLPPQEYRGACNTYMSSIAFDGQGRIWVSFYKHDASDTYYINQLNYGLGMYDGQKWTYFQTSDSLNPNTYPDYASGSGSLLIDDQARLWVGLGSRLIMFDLNQGIPIPDPIPGSLLQQQISYRRNAIWLGIGASLSVLAACWLLFLGSSIGSKWTHRLKKRSPTTPPHIKIFAYLAGIFCGGIGSAICFLFLIGMIGASQNPVGLILLNTLRIIAFQKSSGLYLCGAPLFSILLFLLSTNLILRQRTPNQLLLGFITAIAGMFIFSSTILLLLFG